MKLDGQTCLIHLVQLPPRKFSGANFLGTYIIKKISQHIFLLFVFSNYFVLIVSFHGVLFYIDMQYDVLANIELDHASMQHFLFFYSFRLRQNKDVNCMFALNH